MPLQLLPFPLQLPVQPYIYIPIDSQHRGTEPHKFSFSTSSLPEREASGMGEDCAEVTAEHLERQSREMPSVAMSQFPCQ